MTEIRQTGGSMASKDKEAGSGRMAGQARRASPSHNQANSEKVASKKRPAQAKARVRMSQAERTKRSREQLLKAAVKVIKKRGYLNFTAVEAAAVAGLSRGGPTHHFKSTDNFLLAALEFMFEEYLGKSIVEHPQFHTVEEVISAMIDDARATYFTEDFYAIFDTVISASKNAKLRSKLQGFSDRLRRPVEDHWRDCLISLGCSPEKAEAAVLVTHGIFRGLAVRKLLTNDPDRIEWTIERGRQMILASLKPDGEA